MADMISKTEDLLYETMLTFGLKPQRQYPISRMKVDFAFPEYMLVVEVDGAYKRNKEGMKTLFERKRACENEGWQVENFTAEETYEDPQKVTMRIIHFLEKIKNKNKKLSDYEKSKELSEHKQEQKKELEKDSEKEENKSVKAMLVRRESMLKKWAKTDPELVRNIRRIGKKNKRKQNKTLRDKIKNAYAKIKESSPREAYHKVITFYHLIFLIVEYSVRIIFKAIISLSWIIFFLAIIILIIKGNMFIRDLFWSYTISKIIWGCIVFLSSYWIIKIVYKGYEVSKENIYEISKIYFTYSMKKGYLLNK